MKHERALLDIKMIEAIRRNECLYNAMCPKYKDFAYKEGTWANIGKEIGLTAMETKTRWKSIRDGYKRFMQKPPGNGFLKPYKYAEQMRFLDNIVTRRISKPIEPASLDDEVSTDLSSEDELKYEIPEKRTKYEYKYDIDNTIDDAQDILGLSATLEYYDADISTTIERTTDDKKPKRKDNGTEKCNTSSKEKQLDKNDWIARLIEEIQKHDCIYNKESEKYKDYEYKKRLWHKIGKKFGLKVKDVTRKWKSLRDSYRRYKLKSKVEGFVNYKHAVSLKFLEDYINIEPSTSLYKSDAEVSTELSSDSEFLYKPPGKSSPLELEMPLEDIKDSWNTSPTNENSDIESNPDTTAEQTSKIDEKNTSDMPINTDSEESCLSSVNEEDPTSKVELNLRIIREVKKHECIYNKQLDQYKNFPYKNGVWYKLAKRVGLRETELRAKWKNLRDGYRRYKLKCLNGDLSSAYKYADTLKFLDDVMDFSNLKKSGKKLQTSIELSSDFLNESDFSTNQELPISQPANDINPIGNDVAEPPSAFTITSRLFQLLANKIHESNLTVQQKNDIEYAVSAVVYSKLAEYDKS